MKEIKENILLAIVIGLMIIGAVLVVSFIGSIVTWFAWNLFMPAVFSLPKITLLQAFALNLLGNIFRSINYNKK